MSAVSHTIVTHAGAFHADEIMAIALLERFYLLRPLRVAKDLGAADTEALLAQGVRPLFVPPIDANGLADGREPCWVLRTRSPNLLAAARANPETFVLDVGGVLEPAALNFDHHQASMTDGWDDGTPYSSTGLAWRWLQEQGHLTELDAATQTELEATLIRPLDAHDNGVALCQEGLIVEAFNRGSGDNEGQAVQFGKALDFLREVLSNAIYRAGVKLDSRRQLERGWALAQSRGEDFVVLEDALPYTDGTGLLKEISDDQAQMLAIPGKGHQYSVISVSGNEGRFSTKCPVPEAWRGRMDFEVYIDGHKVAMAFAHKTGFMCVVKGGPNDAHRVAKAVVAHNRENAPGAADATVRAHRVKP